MRIRALFERTKAEGRGALGVFITGGDPDLETSRQVLLGLPGRGVDFVELGMPFSDPMADGASIQAASLRALASGVGLGDVLGLASEFRSEHPSTPLILMGYYNPIYRYGVDAFLSAATEAGVDGLIIVDVPPEEDAELCVPAREAGLDFIRLVAPTTDDKRMAVVLAGASGFVYYVSITGITGTGSASASSIDAAVVRIRQATDVPIVVGFGIRTAEHVRQALAFADGVVVGSAVVERLASGGVDETLAFVAGLAKGSRANL